jgi:hypothetical protein
MKRILDRPRRPPTHPPAPPVPPPAPAPVVVEVVVTFDDKQLGRVTGMLEQILTRVTRLEAQGVRSMANLSDLKRKADEILADVESETDVVTSVETLLTGQTEQLAALKAALDEAIANNDQAALQAVSDALDTIATTNAAAKARTIAAVVKNTPAAPTPIDPLDPPVDPPVDETPSESDPAAARGRR